MSEGRNIYYFTFNKTITRIDCKHGALFLFLSSATSVLPQNCFLFPAASVLPQNCFSSAASVLPQNCFLISAASVLPQNCFSSAASVLPQNCFSSAASVLPQNCFLISAASVLSQNCLPFSIVSVLPQNCSPLRQFRCCLKLFPLPSSFSVAAKLLPQASTAPRRSGNSKAWHFGRERAPVWV